MKLHLFFVAGLLTASCINNNSLSQVQYCNESKNDSLCDMYFPVYQNKELTELRNRYKLEQLVSGAKSDLDKAMILLNWTHGLWRHNGSNEPKKNDALSILKEVEEGKKFRCVEYAIVLSASLNSIGIPARTLGLYTKNVEMSECCAGHVATEAYLPNLKKWVFLDAQMNYVPFYNGIPLNTVEYQNAIFSKRSQLKLKDVNGEYGKIRTSFKVNWVTKYLFYLHSGFDFSGNRTLCHEKRGVILVPLNEKNPTVFQINNKIDSCFYTNNIKDFYKEPKYYGN